MDKHKHPDEVGQLRSKTNIQNQQREMLRATTKKKKTNLQTLHGVNDRNNPLLLLPVDFARLVSIRIINFSKCV